MPWKDPLDHPGDDTGEKTQGRKLQNAQEGFRGILGRQGVRILELFNLNMSSMTTVLLPYPAINPWQTLRQCSFCARQMLILQKKDLKLAFLQLFRHRHLYQEPLHWGNHPQKWKKQPKKLHQGGLPSYLNGIFSEELSVWSWGMLLTSGQAEVNGAMTGAEVWPSGESPHIPAEQLSSSKQQEFIMWRGQMHEMQTHKTSFSHKVSFLHKSSLPIAERRF